ncbi:hypothetical protein DFJ58DRAFT_258518 [Suillus subalutaceus]|uniref:uncharacterized protein n=1 Tax=Suillus subalutaceus TaxID=48586 RepID=UPI001B87D40A|nr:uncharacterized protein DFJ58DRAFT_258518 [Suillus subalutaceus]KAG1875546.1 hypothetical protein DFJ58DRAFT_258518 [Suillus subalutaceus]
MPHPRKISDSVVDSKQHGLRSPLPICMGHGVKCYIAHLPCWETSELESSFYVWTCRCLYRSVSGRTVMLTGSSEEDIHLPTAGAHQGGARGISLALGTSLVALTLPFLHVSLPARIDTLFEVSSLGVACAREDRHPALGDNFIAETSKLTSQAHQILWPESVVVFNSQEE